MAYQGTTAVLANPPRLLNKAWGSTYAAAGTAMWQYASTHVQVDVASTGFFADGFDLGMNLGDVVIVIGSGSTVGGLGPMSMPSVDVVTSTGVGLSAGLICSSSS